MTTPLVRLSGDDSAATSASDEESQPLARTVRTVNGASAQAVSFGRSWWALTTDPTFLTSRASRRDMWAVLLPLVGIVAIVFDAPRDVLIVLDACLALCLVGAAWLPIRVLWSDATVAAIFAAYMMGRGILASDASTSFEFCQVLVVFAMASAGVHTVAVASFLLASTLTTPQLQTGQRLEVFVACAYVVCLNVVMEHRVAQVVARPRQTTGSGYKALDLQGVSFDTQFADASVTRIPAGVLDDLRGSPGAVPSESSRTSSLAELWSNFSFKPSQALRLPRKKPPQRFEAMEVTPPTASEHEPPEFAEDKGQGRTDAPQSSQEQEEKEALVPRQADPPVSEPSASPGQTARIIPEQEQALRGVKLNGFSLPELNVLFVERKGQPFAMNDRETYWSAANDFFLYYSKSTNTWGAAKAKRFQQVKHGQSHGFAHSPEGAEIWDKATGKGWREWEPQANQWVVRPDAGVESRGKVKPMTAQTPKVDVAVQTDS